MEKYKLNRIFKSSDGFVSKMVALYNKCATLVWAHVGYLHYEIIANSDIIYLWNGRQASIIMSPE
jgi:hypothetical protein